MSIASIIVAVRTTGAAALNRLAAQFAAAAGKASSLAASLAMVGVKAVALAAVIVPLVGIVGNLLGIIQLVAPAVGALALMLGTLKLATNGFSDALSAGLSGDMKEFEKALKKLTPSAREAVRALIAIRNQWRSVQKAVQEKFFFNLSGDFQAVAAVFKPLAEKWLPRIASSFADARHAISDVFFAMAKHGPEGESIFRNLSLAIDNILRSLAPLAQAFTDVLYVASPRFESLTSDAATLAQKFADWIREAKNSGKLGQWLDKAIETMGKLKELGGNILGILKAIFRAGSDDGDNFLDTLIGITEAFDKWMNSADGQQIIDLFGKLTSVMIGLTPVWEFLIGLVQLTIELFKGIGKVASYMWDGAKAALSFFVGLAINSFYAILLAASKAFGWIPGIGPKLKQAEADFRKFAAEVNNQLNGIQKSITITVRARVIGGSLLNAAQQSGSYSSGIGGRAVGGPVVAGRTYMVGERGPELVTFGSGAHVTNADDTAAAMGGWSNRVGGLVLDVRGGERGLASLLKTMIRNGDIKLVVTNGRVSVA